MLWSASAGGAVVLLALLLVSAATWPSASTQAVDPSSPDVSYNCSHSYRIRPSDEGSSRPFCSEETCVETSPLMPDTVSRCLSIRQLLSIYNSVIHAEDCLELMFAPGVYHLSSLPNMSVQYSLVMSAPEGGVSLTCARPTCACETQDTLSPPDSSAVPMMVFNSSQVQEDMFVKISGIEFRNCSRQLQFNNVDSLSVTDCQFM